MNEKNENTLIELNNEFWARAYQTNIGKLVGVCYRYTGNFQLSEDLAQDAFLKAIEKKESFRGEGNFDAWLRRITVNQVLQYLRNQKSKPFLQPLRGDEETAITPQENMASIRTMEFTVSELLETIDRLPEHHRLVFNLYVLDKFSHARIGEALGISEGTSKSHLARARKKLQQLLSEKIQFQKEQGNEERAAFLLIALADDTKTDALFQESFDHFSMAPQNPLPLNFGRHTVLHHVKKIVLNKSVQIIPGFSVTLAVVMVIYFLSKGPRHSGENKTNIEPVPSQTAQDSLVNKNSSENIPSQTATISPPGINNGKNIKLHSMKPLDSLALMLALSTSSVNSLPLKDSIRQKIEKPALEQVTAPDSSQNRDQSTSAGGKKIDSEERGTFRATELFWNRNNLEVDFKGAVRVDFKEQHFQGKGTFNFLGKVHLLLVDGQPAELGAAIKLSNQDYRLTELNGTEAGSKYGDAGKFGAILINRSE